MEKVTFTNERGETIIFDQEKGPYFLEYINGTGAIETISQMQKAPFQDGKTLIDKILEPRPMPTGIVIVADNETELYQRRAYLSRVLNSKLKEGILKYEYPGGSKNILATVDLPPQFPSGSDSKQDTFQKSVFEFLAPNPFWTDTTEEEWVLATFEGGFSFPFSFPFNLGTVGQEVIVDNKGDVDTPVLIRFKGPLSNPILENVTTGKKITLTKDLLEGEVLEINTEFGNKRIEIIAVDGTRSNGFHYISPTSELWSLVPGENKLSHAATTGASDSSCTVYFKNRYVGV